MSPAGGGLACRVLWVMLDGVGLASPGPANPLAGRPLAGLGRLGVSTPAGPLEPGSVTRAVDARLGVAGLPQSATGQTTLLTGVNAAARLGYHHGPWPGPSLRPLLESSLPARLGRSGGAVRLAGAYPPAYVEAVRDGKRRLNAVALAASLGGARLEPEGVPATLGDEGSDLEAIRGWGHTLAASAADLTIFDAWWSDHLGHRGTFGAAVEYVNRLDALLVGILEALPRETLLVLTSDHGNFEAMDLKTHTLNPVPLAAVGPGALEFEAVADLGGVAPAIERATGWGNSDVA